MQTPRFACRTWMGSVLQTEGLHGQYSYSIFFWQDHARYTVHPKESETIRPFLTHLHRSQAMQIPNVTELTLLTQQTRNNVDHAIAKGHSHVSEIVSEIGCFFTDHEGRLGLYWHDGSPITYLSEWMLRALLRQPSATQTEKQLRENLSIVATALRGIPPFPAEYEMQVIAGQPALQMQDGLCASTATILVAIYPSERSELTTWWQFEGALGRWCMLHMDLKTPASRYFPLPDEPVQLCRALQSKLNALFQE